jgi:L-malate glycosyltransferase
MKRKNSVSTRSIEVLVLPSFYPTSLNPALGSFFASQVKALSNSGVSINVHYVEQSSLRFLSIKKIFQNRFQFQLSKDAGWSEYRILGWNIPGVLGVYIWKFLTIRLVERYIKLNGKPDLIHAHNFFYAGHVSLFFKKKYKIPIVLTEHDSGFIMNEHSAQKTAFVEKGIKDIDQVLAVSKGLARSVQSYDKTISIEVIPNIVDTDFFVPCQKRTVKDRLKFISIGNLTKNKGHSLLLDAFKELLKVNKNISLTICGSGKEERALLLKIKKLGLEEKVILTGHLDREDILIQIQQSDCLVLPSYFETFGVVLIEALSCGIPFIATRSGGANDIHEDGIGYLVDTGDWNQLYDAMRLFIAHRANFSSDHIRSFAVKNYGESAVTNRIKKIYKKIVRASEKI